ncbi:MAG: hypothetical protein J3K34DRAFT_402708 [Monoraphidium minutum]|nr:MAG: hypothetical protein J3K34DRAFT_402708 [Monoraphidium minutum]
MQALQARAMSAKALVRPSAVRPASLVPAGLRRPAVAVSAPSRCSRKQLSVRANAGDITVSGDSLGPQASTIRNLSWSSFWVQLPLSVVSGSILFFAAFVTRSPSDISRVCTFLSVGLAFISTFFAHGFLTLARRAINEGKAVKRSDLVANLTRGINLNLVGVGTVLIGLQASVGTLVSKTMLGAANAPYATPQPGATLVSLDVFSLQASTNVLLAHFMAIVFSNLMLATLNRLGATA